LGDVVDKDVRASVNGGEMLGSLLGMSYLNRFTEISIRGDRLILKR
jgi:aspartyl protease family protein